MKKTTIFTTMLMSSVILGAQLVNAAEVNVGPTILDSNASVSFKAGGEGEIDPEDPLVPDVPGDGGEVENPDPENPGGVTPGKEGPLMIEFAPNFYFGGDHEIEANDMSFPALNKFVSTDDKTKFVNHFIQVKDTRGGSKGWKVTVKASPLMNDKKDSLDDTKIIIDNTKVIGLANAELKGDVDFKEITFDNKEIPVMSAEVNQGGGRWWKSFASEVTTTEDVNKEVHLDIPVTDAAKLSESKYSSTLTWEIVGLNATTLSATPESK